MQATLAGDAGHLRSTPLHQWNTLDKIGLTGIAAELPGVDLSVDALLSHGGHGDPRAPVAQGILQLNASRTPVLSLDVPSGLDATTGAPGNPCIRAARTLTLALPKTGLLEPAAREYVGELWLADIGVPSELYRSLGRQVGALFAEDTIIRVD